MQHFGPHKYALMMLYMGKHLKSYKVLIGQKIQKRRIEKGFLNQGQLAKKIGTDQSRISSWESGKSVPEGQLKAALGDLLDVEESFFELVDVDGEKEKLILDVQAALPALDEEQLHKILRMALSYSGASAPGTRLKA